MNIKKIKAAVMSLKDKKFTIVYKGSRNKKEKFSCSLVNYYRNIFTVKLDSGEVRSFSYGDVLTKTIKIYC